MFDIVRNNRRVIQIFLALIMLPFAFFGVDSYFRNSAGGAEVATVGGSKIGMQEFQQALREQQERLKPALGGKVDPAMLDNPELRAALLGNLVNQRLIGLHAQKSRLTVSDDQLVRIIAAAPALQEDGKFSPQRYEMLVAAQGMSKEMFEARMRHDLAMQQAMAVVSDAAFTGRTAADRWVAAQLEERDVAEVLLRADQYVGQVKLAPDAVKTFYEANRRQFEVPEQARVEYVVLSQEKMRDQIKVSDEEIKNWYQSHADQFKSPEERRASHILLMVPKDAPADQDKAARAKAEEILAQVRKTPADFAKLAKQHSQDPGSAQRGGDLDWFGRGMMVPPFEQATFALKENEISGVVRSDFGYHIIKLTGVRPERVKPLDEVRKDIAEQLKQQAVARKYGEFAEGFTNTVYEQSDSLKPAAEKYGLAVQTSDWIVKGGQALPPFTNPKLMAALFSDEAVKNKRNTEAVEVAANTLVAARIVEHKPAALQPLESVAASIEKLLVRQEAAKLAAKDGQEKLARLAKGEVVDVSWSAPRAVVRAYTPNLPREAVDGIFKARAAKLPVYAGVSGDGGFVMYRISQIRPYAPAAEEPPRAKALREQYQRIVAEEEFGAWLTTLRQRYPVEINKAALEARER